MIARHRSRLGVVAGPTDIRALRLALGLSLEEGAKLLGEQPQLVQAQEAAGLSADTETIHEWRRRYLVEAARWVGEGRTVPRADTGGTPCVAYGMASD